VAVPSKPLRPPSPTRRGRVTPSAPIGTRRRTDAGSATSAPARSGAALPASRDTVQPSPGAGRSSRGDHLLLVFSAATMIMVVAVVLVGTVDRMWVLVPVMLVDLAVTFAVIATLVSLIGDDGGPAA
jgi:hypothetical protein